MAITTIQTTDPVSGNTTTTTDSPPVKPGWKTTEFWFGIAATLLSALFASGVIPTTGTPATIAGIAAAVLIALGYKVSRTMVKTAAAGLLVFFLVSSTMTACTQAKTAGAAIIDCTKTNYQVAAVELAKCTTWSCVYDTAIGFGYTVGGCAFRDLVDKGTLLAGAARSAAPTTGSAEFERFRAAIAGGATYRTAQGDE